MKKVSVIVAIYNIENYLNKCLESLRLQTFLDYEVLCVNDGSTDNSKMIIEEYCIKDNHFILLDKENGGLSDARNYGLKHCDSEYVMFVDGDDFVEKDFIKDAYEMAQKHSSDIVVFDYNQYYLSTNTKEIIHEPFEEAKAYSLKDNKEILCCISNCAWNKLYKRSLFVENNIEYPKGYIQEDLGTTAKLLYLANKISFISHPLYNYLIDRPNNISQEKNEKIYHTLAMCESIISFYKDNSVFEEYYEELKCLCIKNILWSLRKLPYYTDKKFVNKFIDDAFDFIKKYFEDFPKSKYSLYTYKEDKIYLNKFLLKSYLFYKRIK